MSDSAFQNVSHSEDKKQSDIMAVYRSPGVGNGFKLYYEEKHREERKRCDAQRAAEYAAIPKVEKPKQDVIYVMVQAFYGNRVITMVDTKDVDRLIHGYLMDMDVKADRKTVRVPDHENLVILYDAKEEKRQRERFEMMRKECSDHSRGPKPLCVIPQYDLQIYSRPLACRMDESGKLLSIEEEDIEIICRYFAE